MGSFSKLIFTQGGLNFKVKIHIWKLYHWICEKIEDIETAKIQKEYQKYNWKKIREISERYMSKRISERDEGIKQRDEYKCRSCGSTTNLVVYQIKDYSYDVNNFITLCRNCVLDKLSPSKFEHLIGEIFKAKGYLVTYTGRSGDEGIDLICINQIRGEKIVVQCKRYKNNIGAHIIRDFYGALVHTKADIGYIITIGEFTKSARKWVEGKPITLINRDKLGDLLNPMSSDQFRK